jgi:ankyrin repeat protein
VGRFLLAPLYLNHLTSYQSEIKVRKALKDLPIGPNAYDAMYSDTIGRIREKPHKSLAMRVLSLIVWVKRPLTAREVQHALAIDDGTEYLDKTSITDIEDIVSACEGLVRLDHKDSTLQLAHYTMQEYLLKNRKILFSDPDPECYILAICLGLLVSPAFAAGFCPTDEEFEKRLDSFPLYDYAARTWGAHALCAPDMDGRVLELLQDRPKLEAMAQCLMAYRRYGQEVPRLMTGLHIAALFGLETGVDALLAAGWDSNARNTYGRSPLSFAAEHGHKTIVRELLRQGAELNSGDNFGKIPFSYACQGGFQTTVEILMGHGAGANTQLRDDFGRSPISYAAQHGHKGIVELLIRRGDTQVDAKNTNGITPLGWAAFGGNLAVARLLVENKVSVDPRDSTGMTPAMRAAKGGHADVFRYLVEEGADVNAADKEGRTSLSHAAELDRQAVVEAFLSRSGADPDLGDGDGWTPLFWAVDEGWAGIVALLLGDERVDANHQDRFGQTALSIAARMGDEAVTKVLLDREGIQVNVPDYTGWTPLIHAAKNGSEEILRLLLAVEQGGVSTDPNQPDVAGQTALHWAAKMGNTGAVRTLVSHPLIDVHVTDLAGRSPMWRAAANGHIAAVAALLDARADVNTQESSGRTALRASVERGQDEVAELLLAQKADPERGCPSRGGWALFHVASFTASSRLQRLLEVNRAVGTGAEDDFLGLVGLFGSDSPDSRDWSLTEASGSCNPNVQLFTKLKPLTLTSTPHQNFNTFAQATHQPITSLHSITQRCS